MTTTKCPHCGRDINPAALLVRRARGKGKAYTPAELAKRTARLAEARKKRWKMEAREKRKNGRKKGNE